MRLKDELFDFRRGGGLPLRTNRRGPCKTRRLAERLQEAAAHRAKEKTADAVAAFHPWGHGFAGMLGSWEQSCSSLCAWQGVS